MRLGKVCIFWEGHKILRNLHLTFVLCNASQKWGGDFAKFCGLLRIYELYIDHWNQMFAGQIKVIPWFRFYFGYVLHLFLISMSESNVIQLRFRFRKSHCNFFITEVKANNFISFQNHMTTNYALQFIPWQCQKNKNKVCMRHWRYKKNHNSYPKRFPRNPFDLLSFFSASCTKAWAFASLSLMISQVFFFVWSLVWWEE